MTQKNSLDDELDSQDRELLAAFTAVERDKKAFIEKRVGKKEAPEGQPEPYYYHEDEPIKAISPGVVVANVFIGIGTLGLLQAFFYLLSWIANKGKTIDHWHEDKRNFVSWCRFQHEQRNHHEDDYRLLVDISDGL